MSSPSFANIDRWLFEWKEGNLSPGQIEQLETFILLHPELEVDKDMWQYSHVQHSKVTYPKTDLLKRRRRILPFLFKGSLAALFITTLLLTYFFSLPTGEASHAYCKRKFALRHNNSLKNNVVTQKSRSTFSNSNKLKKMSVSMVHPLTLTHFSSPNLTVHTLSVPEDTMGSGESISIYSGTELLESSSATLSSYPTNEGANAEILLFDFLDNDSITRGTAIVEPISLEEVKSTSAEIKLHQAEKDKESTKRVHKMELSLDMRWRKFSRTVKRMVDNPIALKNVKDPIFLTPGMQAVDINFGSTGKLLTTRIQATSRAQWFGQQNEQFLNQVSIDGYSYAARGGLGLQMNHSYYSMGQLQHSNAAVIYSPKISLTRNIMLEPSLRFKMGNKSLNTNLLVPGQSFEVERNNIHLVTADNLATGSSLWYRDIGAGIQLNTKWFYIGGQLDNLAQHYDNMFKNQGNQSQRSAMHSIISIGTEYESIRKTTSFSPYIIYQKKGSFEETWFGAQLRYHWLTAGLAVSDQLEPAASVGLKFKHIMLLYSADYLKSNLVDEFKLSHQLTIRVTTKPSRFAQRLLNQL